MILSELMLEAPATVSGVAATLCLTAAPMFRSRRMILIAQLCAGLCFATHYAFLGIAVASAVNVLGAVQTGTAIFSTRSAAMDRLGYALIVLMAATCLWFWQGPVSVLSMFAMVLIALGRMQTDELRLRALVLAGGVFWVAHDALAEAWIALAADIGAFVAGAAVLFSLLVRVTVEWRPRPSAPRKRAT